MCINSFTQYRRLMPISISLFMFVLVFTVSTLPVHAVEKQVFFRYFYINVCESCREADETIDYYTDILRNANNSISIRLFSHNIALNENVELLQEYYEAYDVPSDRINVPVLFAGNDYYIGVEEIERGLSDTAKKLADGTIEQLKLIEGTSEGAGIIKERFDTLKAFNVFLIGLVNGLNPCSLSMLLFLLSLIVARQNIKVLSMGISFVTGKFFTYLLLGTLLHGFFSEIQMHQYNILLKSTLGLFVLIMAYLNIKDFFSARREKYGEIKNQLPSGLRKWNHQVISNITSRNRGAILIIAGGALGIIISVGEFLCTGQVYLATILYILRTENDMSIRALIYFVTYSFAFIIPALIFVIIISRTRELMQMSEAIRKRMPLIKLLTAGVLLITGLITILFT